MIPFAPIVALEHSWLLKRLEMGTGEDNPLLRPQKRVDEPPPLEEERGEVCSTCGQVHDDTEIGVSPSSQQHGMSQWSVHQRREKPYQAPPTKGRRVGVTKPVDTRTREQKALDKKKESPYRCPNCGAGPNSLYRSSNQGMMCGVCGASENPEQQ